MKSASELKKYGVKIIDELEPQFQCVYCEHIWTPDKRSDGKLPCEYWYCPRDCTDWRWQNSGNGLILEDSVDFFQVPFIIKSSGLCKKYIVQKIRKEIAEQRNIKEIKELNKEFLFGWPDGRSDITAKDKIRIKELFNKDVDVNWIENAEIKKYKKSIKLIDRNNEKNALSFTYERNSKVSLKIKNKDGKIKKFLNLALEIENDMWNIYKLPKIDLALYLEVDTCRLNYQDVDNIQKTVLDALKRDKKDSLWNCLYEDDAQIFRVLCWKTEKQDDDKYNMAAITISFRVYNPEKCMCMVKLDN